MSFKSILRGVVTALFVALPALAQAQVAGGNITGTATDDQGGVMPGVTVTIQGADLTQTFVTDGEGRYRFLDLAPGTYKVTSALDGFATNVRANVILDVGKTVDLPVTMKIGRVTETVTVTAASPIVDAKQTGTATNFTRRRTVEDPDLARSVLADALGARRARRSRQHRRQRDRPAVELRRRRAPGRRTRSGRWTASRSPT